MSRNTRNHTRPGYPWLGLARYSGSLLVYLAIASVSSPALASHCGSPPSGFGGAWASQYASWCRCMGGSYNSSTTSCSGATGGHSNSGYSGGYSSGISTGDPRIDAMMPVMEGLFGAIGQGIANSLFGNPQEEARRRRERELAAQRAAEEAQRRAAEEARRREAEHKDLMANLMPVPGSAAAPAPDALPTGVEPAGNGNPTYATADRKGHEDAEQCYPENAFGYCMAATPEESDSCVEGYRAGFTKGKKRQREILKAAYDRGKHQGAEDSQATGKPRLSNAFWDPDAQGPCRTYWTEAYNRGYFAGKNGGAAQ